MNENPFFVLLMLAAGIYSLNIWRQDFLAARAGTPNPGALPGATTCSLAACVIAAAGAIVILVLETWGEIRLGVSDQQSEITVLFGLYSLMAAFIEELIFRGFIVVQNRGRYAQWGGAIAASVLFAALHPFLWNWEDSKLVWTIDAKGWFSTAAVFVSSLWFYTVRFAGFNPNQSLIPSITAHATKNLGVFAVKAVQGFVVGFW